MWRLSWDRGHPVRGKLHQPHDLTTFFSACPARIPNFLLGFPAVTNGLRSGFRGHATERIRTSHAVMETAIAHVGKNEAENRTRPPTHAAISSRSDAR